MGIMKYTFFQKVMSQCVGILYLHGNDEIDILCFCDYHHHSNGVREKN